MARPDPLVPAAIGGALQAAYVARLRTWLGDSESVPVAERLADLDRSLAVICTVLQPLYDGASGE
jgi:hypothetical protein